MTVKYLACVAMCLTLFCSPAFGQESSSGRVVEFQRNLTKALDENSPTDFVKSVQPLLEQREVELTKEEQEDLNDKVARKAKAYLLDESVVRSASGDELMKLTQWARSQLSKEERLSIAKVVEGSPTKTLWEHVLQTQVRESLEGWRSEDVEARRASFAAKLRKVGVKKANDLELLYANIFMTPSARSFDGFTVVWEGKITAPRTGEYEFSTSPFQISTRFEDSYHRQFITVEVAGNKIISTTPESWDYVGKLVSLTGGQSVPFRVELKYEYSDFHTRIAPCQLKWKGPGVAEQLVPASAFSQESGKPGVHVSGKWRCFFPDDNEVRDVQSEAVVSQVDQCFFRCVLCEDLDLVEEVTQEKVARMITPKSMKSLLVKPEDGGPAVQHAHCFLRGRNHPHKLMLETCSSKQRKEVAKSLVASPDSIAVASLADIHEAYNLMRVGAEREALDLIGTWMVAHANIQPEFSANVDEYYRKNRYEYRRLTIPLVWEHPESIQWLEDDYLETDKGVCVLPVAYTVAYGYLVQGKINDWISKLDARLSEKSLSGDLRVNWLIARAMAEEIRITPGTRHFRGHEKFLAGKDWLNESMLTASSKEALERLTKERASRLVAAHRWGRLEQLVQRSPSQYQWLSEIDSYKLAREEELKQSEIESQAAFIDELKRRQEAASGADDKGLEEYYGRLVGEAKEGS